jgi:hypothetical protein
MVLIISLRQLSDQIKMQRGNFPAQRSNAIYGDANAQTATVVPDLAAAADGVNFAVSADSSILNFNQRLDLQDLIYETSTEEVYASVIAPGHLVIQGNTMGWTDMSKMVLEFDINLTRADVNPVGDYADKIAYDGTSIKTMDTNNAGLLWSPPSEWNMPNFNMLQPLDQLVIQMGENNQVIGRSQMNYLQGIKMVAQDNKLAPEEFREIMMLGNPNTQANTAYLGANVPWAQTASYANTAEFNNWFNGLYEQLNRYVDISSAPTANIPSTNIDNIPFIQPQSLKVGIPLKFLNSFFRTSAYLPPGLKYRIEINYNTSKFFFGDYIKSLFTGTLDNQIQDVRYKRWDISYGTDMRLTYRRSTLRQPQAASIMNQWITTPFLYLYNTYEFVEIPTNGSQTVFMKDIAISQQRPSSIFIKCLPDYNGTEWVNRPMDATNQLQNSRTTNTQTRDYKSSDCTFVSFTNIKIDIAGRQQYYLRTRNPAITTNIPSLFDGTEMVNQLATKNVDQFLDEQGCVAHGFMAQYVSGGVYQISINPGDMQKNGYMSSDVGATVIRVTFTATQNTTNNVYLPIPKDYKLVIYKRLQEEIELNGKKEITTISWPAVKSNSDYLIQNTYNLN